MHDLVTPLELLPLHDVRVLAISPTPTHPTTAGNRARYRALLERLQARGATVRLLHVTHEAGDLPSMEANWSGGARQIAFCLPPARHEHWNRFAHRCWKYLSIPVPSRVDVDDWYDKGLGTTIDAEVATFRPDVVVMMYFWYSAALASMPSGIRRVLDAQDVFTDRNARMRASGIEQAWYSVSAREEARGLDRFDVVLAIQEHEAEHYRALTKVPVVTVGHFLPLLECGPVSPDPTLLIIGSDNDVNVHGVNWFLREVWPAVRAQRPDAMLRLVGRICDKVPPTTGVEMLGVVSDLAGCYSQCAMVVNPLQGGTGLKIKGAEALGAGRVVISTPVAALGLEAAFDAGIVVCATPRAMQDAILQLLADRRTLHALSESARTFARSWNDRYERRFDQVFAPLQKHGNADGSAVLTTHTPYADDAVKLSTQSTAEHP